MSFPPLSINFSYPDKTVMHIYISMAAELGIKRLSIDAATIKKVAEDPEFGSSIVKAAENHHITFFDAHAPHALKDSLGNPFPDGLEHSTNLMLRTLRAAADVGVRVVTMHPGRTRLVGSYAPESGPIDKADLDGAVERTLRQLDVLIPEAEKLGVIIALENLFLPSATASHLKRIMERARHAHLGFCYDSGHALLMEKMPGKPADMIVDWIALGWENDTVIFQEDQLDLMLEDVITTHFHDNDGTADLHQLPGEGRADWEKIAERMKKAPRLLSVQSEVNKLQLTADLQESFGRFARAGFPVK